MGKILFGKITHHLYPGILKVLVNNTFEKEASIFHPGFDLFATEIEILFVKLKM